MQRTLLNSTIKTAISTFSQIRKIHENSYEQFEEQRINPLDRYSLVNFQFNNVNFELSVTPIYSTLMAIDLRVVYIYIPVIAIGQR